MSVCKVCGGDAGLMGVICTTCERRIAHEQYEANRKKDDGAISESTDQPKTDLYGQPIIPAQSECVPELLTSTTNEIDRYRTLANLGVVRGSSVRSRNIGSEAVAGLKAIVGGELKGVTKLIADAREQALARMLRDAESLGANAIIGMRFSTSQVWESAAEVMAYGTAVVVEPKEGDDIEVGN